MRRALSVRAVAPRVLELPNIVIGLVRTLPMGTVFGQPG